MTETAAPLLSIVTPAYNEAAGIGENLKRVRDTLVRIGFSDYETIVSDDASTDETARIAEEAGARVVHSGKRNIGATRNVGAKQARGEWILFLDADTYFEPDTARELLKTIERGNWVGGGATIRWSEPAPWTATPPTWIWNSVSRFFKFPCGSFFFARRDVFEEVGGFDEQYFAGEELALAKRLKTKGRLRILKNPLLSSPRKVHQFSAKEMILLFLRWIPAPKKNLRTREGLDYWYSRRDS